MNLLRPIFLGCGLLLSVGSVMEATAQSPMGTAFTYQGRLMDNGVSADGVYDIRFVLYDSEVGGSQVGGVITRNDVPVNEGLVSLRLDFGANIFEGEARWLEIRIRPGAETGAFTILDPRLLLTPAPYAIFAAEAGSVSWDAVSGLVGTGSKQIAEGLHDHFGQSWFGEAIGGLEISNDLFDTNAFALRGRIATGVALRGESAGGYGVYGYSENYGVYGQSDSPTQGSGYGGYFLASGGIGVYGESQAQGTAQNLYAPGVFGRSQNGVGVFGEAPYVGVLGMSSTGAALRGQTTGGFGVYGYSKNYGVYGESDSPEQGRGYGGYFLSTGGIGVYGESRALLTLNNLYAPGVFGYSQRGAGVMGRQGTFGTSVAGFFDGRVFIDGDLVVTGTKTGFVADIAINDDPLPLEAGDVVVVTGYEEPVVGEIPLVKVRKAQSAGSRSVVGVVNQPFMVPSAQEPQVLEDIHFPTPAHKAASSQSGSGIQQRQYLTIVTLGAFQALKVDASYGAIQPGDLLVSSENPGYAKRSDDPRAGTIIAKALGELSQGTGTIPVMVMLQ